MPKGVRFKPRGDGLVVAAKITLYPGRDDPLIALLQEAPDGRMAGIIRALMRAGLKTQPAADAHALLAQQNRER